jgi:hypothetical protein
MGISTAPKLLDRGVWWADYLNRGRPVLLAVDSHGECIRRVRLERDEDEEIAREWLEGLLEHYDPPRPRLALVPRSERPHLSPQLFVSLLRPKR